MENWKKMKDLILNEQKKMRQYDASYDVNIFCSIFMYIVVKIFFQI